MLSGGRGKEPKIIIELATCGVFDFPFGPLVSPATDVSVNLGDRQYGTYTYAEILIHPMQEFYTVPNLHLYTSDFKFFLSASIKDLNGNMLVEIKDNKWMIYKKNVGKYNYDTNGFEVYDKAGHISLSLDFKPANQSATSLTVQGVIPLTSNTLHYYKTYRFFPDFQFGTPELNQAFDEIYFGLPITPIFRYEGSGWRGARL